MTKAATSRERRRIRSWGARMAFPACPETVRPRRGPCEAHYGVAQGAAYGRYKPRYGPVWWW